MSVKTEDWLGFDFDDDLEMIDEHEKEAIGLFCAILIILLFATGLFQFEKIKQAMIFYSITILMILVWLYILTIRILSISKNIIHYIQRYL